MTDITPNYTEAMTADMTDRYNADPTLDTARAIAKDFGKSTKSVVAKLVSLGIYKKAEKASKTGKPVIQKAQLVARITKATGMEMPSLVKATKDDLFRLIDAIGA